MSNEKFPLFPSLESSFIVARTESETVSLREKAKAFKKIVRHIKDIFNVSGVWNNEEDKRYSFEESIARYQNYCRDLMNASSEMTTFSGITQKKRPRYSFDKTENAELDNAIVMFERLVETFFQRSDISIQKNILGALNNRIAALDSEQNETRFLQRIEQNLQYLKLLSELAYIYNPITDALLNVYVIAETLKTPRDSSAFVFFDKWTPRFPQENFSPRRRGGRIKQAVSFTDAPLQLKKQEKEIKKTDCSIEEICSLLTDEDVYAEIEVKDDLFQGNIFNDVKIKNLFLELAQTSKVFSDRLTGISQDLLTILNGANIKEEDRDLITSLQESLLSFIALQTAFYEAAQTGTDQLSKNPFDPPNVLHCFLNLYEGDAFRKQMELLPFLLNRLGKLNLFFKENKERCKILPTISSGVVNYVIDAFFVQACVRRKDLAENIFKYLPLANYKDTAHRLKEVYKQICYVPQKSEFLIDIEKRGFIRPIGLKKLMNRLEAQANKPYSLAHILIKLGENNLLKKAFLSFANKIAGITHKLEFFQKLYFLLYSNRDSPLCLEDLQSLQPYFDRNNLLELPLGSFRDINTAFNSTEAQPAIIIKGIIAVLIPVLTGVHDNLEKILKEFQFSYDIIDILPNVAEIEGKLNGAKTLAVLNRHDIATLPAFWRDIFMRKESALVGAFAEKQQSITKKTTHSIDASNFLMDIQDSKEEYAVKLREERLALFVERRRSIAKNFIEREIIRQIELIEKANIFHEDCLCILRERKRDIYSIILKNMNLSEEEDRLFLFNYAKALLDIPGYVLKNISKCFTKELVEKGNVFNTEFVAIQKICLDKEALIPLLWKLSTDYCAQNSKFLQEIKKPQSAFRLSGLLRNKLNPEIYTELAKEIVAASNKKDRAKMGTNLAPKTPMVLGSRLSQGDRPLPNNLCPETPSTPLSATIGMTNNIGSFQRLVEDIEQKTAVDASLQWCVKKYIKSTNALIECNNAAACNFIEVYENIDLVLTAEVKMKESVPNSPAVLPAEDLCITAYRHKESDVAMAVSSMVESMRATGKSILDIKIAASASEVEANELIEKYVGEALEYGVFPRVTLGDMVLNSIQLEDRLRAISLPLVRKYQYKLEMNLSQNNRRFFATCGQEEQGVAGKRSAACALSFEVG